MPRQARSTATVDAISKAAVQVLLSEGGRRLTMTRVAERAGVSVGTMYQYFPHKRALLYAVLHRHFDEYVESFEAACLRQHGQSTAVIAAGIVDAFVDAKIRQSDASRALYRIAAELDTDELRIGMSRRLQDACSALLASAADSRFDDISDVSFTLLTAMNGTLRAFLELGDVTYRVDMLRKQLLTLCRGYLAAAANGCGSPSDTRAGI
ncbi:MAG: TetR/AcrR family transcriptional regulator [Propionivibrio sp.]